MNPNDMTGYPTTTEVFDRVFGRVRHEVIPQPLSLIKAAIDIERERVAKEAGVVLDPIARDEAYDRDYIPLPGGWEVQTQGFGSTFRLCSPSGDRIAITDGRVQEELQKMALDIRAAYTCQPSLPAGEPQNSASNPLSPGEYFRCDECHEPAGTRQVCRSCVRLEIEMDDAGEVSCWRVAGGTWVDGEPLPCDYKDAEQNGWAIELAYISPVFAGKTGTETRALVVQTSAEDRADAERYRWLRSQPNDTSVPRIDVVHWVEDDESANAGTGLRMEELDAAIDAARADHEGV